MLYNNLDRVWVVTKVPLPQYHTIQFREINFERNCNWIFDKSSYRTKDVHSHSVNREHMSRICAATQPIIDYYKSRESHYQKLLEFLMETEIKYALNGLVTIRHKRFISALVPIATSVFTIASEAISAHLQRKRIKAIKKGLDQLRKSSVNDKQKFADALRQVQNDFIMTGEFSLNSTTEIIKVLNNITTRHSVLEKIVTGQLSKWPDLYLTNAQGAALFSYQVQLYIQMIAERHSALYEPLVYEARQLLKAIAKLSKGYLPPEIFGPHKLSEILAQVETAISRSHPGFKLALPHLTHYYDMKLVTFGLDPGDNSLVITFPVFIVDHHRHPMTLYEIETVPVPIVDNDLTAQSYTRVQTSKPYIAVNKDYYIQLKIPELRMCKKIRNLFFCEELFLVKHKSKHSCASAIYFDLGPDVIKENCIFKYMHNATVTPSVLDGGEQIVLANMVKQKKLICQRQFNLAQPFNDNDYILVNRSILCDCEIESDMTYVLRSAGSCSGPHNLEPLQFTVNLAFYMFMKDIVPELNNLTVPTDVTDHEYPLPISLPSAKEYANHSIATPQTLTELVERYKRHLAIETQPISTDHIEDPTLDFLDTDEWPKVFTFCAAILTLICSITIVYLCVKQGKLRALLTAVTMPALTEATPLADPELVICQEPLLTKFITIITLAGIFLYAYKFLRHFASTCHGYKYDNVTTVQMFISREEHFLPITLLSRPGNPFLFRIENSLRTNQLTLQKNLLWDLLLIDWESTNLHFLSEPIPTPHQVLIPLRDKCRLRYLMQDENFRIQLKVKQGPAWQDLKISEM